MSSPDENPTHHFTSSAAAGGLQTTNLKTMPKNSEKSTESSSDPLKPHIVEEEAFKAAYKAGNIDYNDSAAFKAQKKYSVKRKLKKAIGNVKNKVGHEEKSDQSSNEDYDLDGTIKRTESGNHLRLEKNSSHEENENEDDKEESNSDKLSKKEANEKDESKSTNASSTNPNEHKKIQSPGDIEKNKIETKENNLTGSKNSKNDDFFDQKRSSSFEPQKVNTVDREKEPTTSVKIDSKAKSANEDKKNNSINSSQSAQKPDVSATAESPQTNSSKPDVPRDNHNEEKLQKGIPNSNSTNSSSKNENGIIERIFSAGIRVYETLFGSTSKDVSDNSSTSNKSTDVYENLGDIAEGPSGTTYRKKSPGDIISLKSSSSEKLDADSQIGQTTDTSFLPSGAPPTCKTLSKQKSNQKLSNVSNGQESGVPSISGINEKDSSVQNNPTSANKLKEAAGEMSDMHTRASEPSLKHFPKGIDPTSASVQPMKDDISLQDDGLSNRNLQKTSSGSTDSNSSAKDSKLAPGVPVSRSHPVDTDTKEHENLYLPAKSTVATTASDSNHFDTSSSGYLVAPAEGGAFAKAPIDGSDAKTDFLTHKDGPSNTEAFHLSGKKSETDEVASHDKSGHTFTEPEIRDNKSKLPEQTSSHCRYPSHQKDSIVSNTEHPTELTKLPTYSHTREVKSNLSPSSARSNNFSEAEDITSDANESPKTSKEKTSTSADPAVGKKVTHDELINNEKASTHNKSFIPTSLGIPSGLETQIAKDPSLTFDSNLKPDDPQIAKTVILPLNEDQLADTTKAKNELSALSSNPDEMKNYKVTSSSQARKPASTISVESQSNRQPIFEKEVKPEFQEPFEYPFSNAQDTGIFDSSGNPPQEGAVEGIASLPIASEQGDQRVPRSGGISNARTKSQGSQTSTSSVTSKNNCAMIAELQGLAQQSYNSHK
jgi:hypothetical protein